MRTKGIAKLLVLLLVLGMAAPALAENANFNEAGLPIVNDRITLKVAIQRHTNDATESYAEKHFAIQAAEATGIDIEWIEISGDTAAQKERISTMLAGDMPDVFIGLLTDDMIVQNTDLFLPLNDLLDQYAPQVMSYYNAEIENWESFLTYPDGNIYGLMGGYQISYNNYVDGLPFINMDWLDALGLEVPTTMDELYDVLVAFRDQDPNGNGEKDEIPLDFCQIHYAGKIGHWAQSWGIPYSKAGNLPRFYIIEEGKVNPTINTPAYREFLEFFHKLAQEGLINLEGFSQTEEQYTSNLDSMRVGVFTGWGPYTYIKGTENQRQYDSIAPVAAAGYTPVVGTNNANAANRNNFVISKSSKYPLEALRWWDYLSSSVEMAMFVNRGEEGLIYRLGEDGVYYANTPTAEDLQKYGYDKYITNIGTSTFAASLGTVNNHPLVKNAISPDIINDPTNTSSIRTIAMLKSEPYFTKEAMTQAIIPAEAKEELDFATDGLEDYINAFAAKSILEGVTDETWNAYLKELDRYGYPEYLDWYQRYLDGDFSE